ncbi:alpha-glucosidase C-terminal domain-containing protein, partial [Streptomyces griseoruber]|uniref:alpha-glucosidase C-terminal domain-containing protein n=3 Tax=Streptomyces griseoruber TaxID=1943 RepID=UPI0037A0A5A3
LDSEKYQLRARDWDTPDTLAPLITRLNTIRRSHPALHHLRNLRFHDADNESVLVYSKRTGADTVIVVVNLDPHHTQEATVSLDLPQLGLEQHAFLSVHDELTGESYTWGRHNYVRLDPGTRPAHVFHVR